jgi:hypothetical protein
MNLKKKALSRQRSQALVEFALVIPLLMLVLMGVFDLGRGIYAYNVVSSAAREGAHHGILKPTDINGIKDEARRNTATLDPNEIGFSPLPYCSRNPNIIPVTPTACDYGNYIVVTVTYRFQPITLFFSTLTLTGKSTMTIECNC